MLEVKLGTLIITTALILVLKYFLTTGKYPGLTLILVTLGLSIASILISISLIL